MPRRRLAEFGGDVARRALNRSERVPNDRANTNGNADAPSGRAVG